jgi:ubiquinol-cytochrome c reductase cytochrome b subunit
MFALVIGALFTGTVLRWDQEGYEALSHNLGVAKLLGGLGFWFSADLASQVPLLLRLYVAHIVIIPGLITLLVVLHTLLVKRHKISPSPTPPVGPRREPARAAVADTAASPADDQAPVRASAPAAGAGEPTVPFTHHLRRVVTSGLVLLAVLTVLAVVFPPGVGPTPVAGIEVTRPLWPFWWMFTLENLFGLAAILWGAAILFALLIAVPFVDRNPERWWRRRPVATGAAVVVVLALVVLTVLTAVSSPAEHL